MTLSLAFIALLSACCWAFCSSGGHGGLLVSTVSVTSPPAPGGSLTAWNSVLGYEIQPGLTSPSGVPGRSGARPRSVQGTKVGSLLPPFGGAAVLAGARSEEHT